MIEYNIEEGYTFKGQSELDHMKLAMDISTIKDNSKGPTRFFHNVVKYLEARPTIIESKDTSAELFAAELLALTLLQNLVEADKRPGAQAAFTKCMKNSKNNQLIRNFSKVLLESIEDGTGTIRGLKFGFDNAGNLTLEAGIINEESVEDLDGDFDIDDHLRIEA